MTNPYFERIKETLFKYSNEEKDIDKAMAEWFWHGEVEDNGASREAREAANEGVYTSCELCGHPDIRFSFTIHNKENGNELKVGSECITKFIEVDDQGAIIRDPVHKRKVLNKNVKKLIIGKKAEGVINNLLAIKKKDSSFPADSFLERFDSKKGFSIKQMKWLLRECRINGIEYDIDNYKLNLRKKKEKEQLMNLERWQFDKLKPIIPKSLQDRYNQKG